MSKRKLSILIIIAVVLGAGLGFKVFGGSEEGEILASHIREVAIASVGALNNDLPILPTVGTVESKTQVTLRTETSGEVRGVYYTQGQFVPAGAIIAELSNATERARLLQAQAGVESAEASLLKVQTGARGEDVSILKTRVLKEIQGLADAKQSVIDTSITVFANIEGAILGSADQMFSNARSSQPQISFTAENEAALEWDRVLIGKSLKEWSTHLEMITATSDLDTTIDISNTVVAEARSFITKLSSALNDAEPHSRLSAGTISGWKTALIGAQGNITNSIASLSASKDRLTNQRAGLAIAESELDRVESGERSEDVVGAEARVKQAQGTLAEVRALFAKTQIRSAISGTLNELSIERGDFVSAFSEIGVVSNNTALQITAFITDDDRPFIAVGASVLIDGKYQGVVTAIAPALNSRTKKIEVTIGITGEASLTNGESVRLAISRSVREKTNQTIEITLPLSALKIRPSDTVVYTQNERGVLIAHPVTLGPIVGSNVVILSGVTAEMEIVLDARGLEEGDVVTRSE